MTDRDRQRLVGVHPRLVIALHRIFTTMDAFQMPMMVVEGVRSLERQQELYAQGRTAPGHIVTNADGIIKKSNHQLKDDGFGHAVDCAFVSPDPFKDSHPWDVYGALAEAVGLEWGGHWDGLVDRPHIELK